MKAVICVDGHKKEVSGSGIGPIDAFSNALRRASTVDFRLLSYHEHALGKGSDSRAVAYIQIENSDREKFWGVGIDTNIKFASYKSILSALNRAHNSERKGGR